MSCYLGYLSKSFVLHLLLLLFIRTFADVSTRDFSQFFKTVPSREITRGGVGGDKRKGDVFSISLRFGY